MTESIGKVVQTIMESLSEAVSGLILLVISFQESGAPMPAHIPPAADGVSQTSHTLADVAAGIATEEYGDYPEIQQPILDAAREVKLSAANLLQAVNFLKTSGDRNKGWSGLLEACRTISGDTVYILQLVYGAELQKLLLAAQHAKELAAKTKPDIAASNPQLFADQVSDLAGHADGLATFIGDKAKEEESPVAREQQQQSAAALANIAKDLPEIANQVLKSPSDPKAKKAFEDKVRQLDKELETASIPVRDKLALQPTKPVPLGHIPPEKPKPQQQFHSQSANVPPPTVRPPPGPVSSAPVPPPEPQDIPKYADKAKEAIRALAKNPNARDTPTIAKEIQALNDTVAPLVDTLERLANDSHDPERAHQLRKAANHTLQQTAKAAAAAANTAKDPSKNNQNALAKETQQAEKLVDAARAIGKAAPEVEIAALARHIAAELPPVVIAAEQGNKPTVDVKLQNLANLTPALTRHLKEFAEKPVHPLKKAAAAEAAKKFEPIMKEFDAAARDVASKPTEKKPLQRLENAKQAADEVLQNIAKLGTELLADSRKQNDELTLLEVAAATDSPKLTGETQKEVVKREPKLEFAAKALASKTEDPVIKKNLVSAVDKLDQIIPEQIRAAEEVVKAPGAEEPKKRLGKNITDAKKAIAEVAAAAEAAPPVAVVSAPSQQLLSEQIQDLMDQIASADPNDDAALQNVLSKFAGPLAKFLADLPEKDADDIVADKIYELQDLAPEIEELVTAAAKGKPDEVERLANNIAKKGKELLTLAKPFAEKYPDEEQRPLLLDALDDLSALLPEVVSTARELAKNPRDPRKKKEAENLANAAAKNVNFVIRAAKPPPEVQAAAAARRFPKGAKRVIEAAKDNDPNALLDALNNLKKTIRDMNKAPVKDEPNYLAGKNIAEAIAELEKQLANKNKKNDPADPAPRPYVEAKQNLEKVLSDPKNHPKPNPKSEALANIRDANNILDRISAAADAPKKDPKKIVEPVKALNKKVDPIIKTARAEAEATKDPETKKKIENALKDLEKALPQHEEAAHNFAQNPNEQTKQELQNKIEEVKAPLENLYAALAPKPKPDDEVAKAAAVLREEKQIAAKLGASANKGDVKAAQDSLKNLKDLQDKLKKAVKDATRNAPPKTVADVAKSVAAIDEILKNVEPAVHNLGKDPKAKDSVNEAVREIQKTLDRAIEAVETIPEQVEQRAADQAKQILAFIRTKDIKKVDPKHLLQVSKQLAGLLSDMVSQTRVDLVSNEDTLNDKARAALDLERLLREAEAAGNKSTFTVGPQNIEEVLLSLNSLSVSGGGNVKSAPPQQPTQLTQQISGVAKEIRAKTANSGSLEGSHLHQISQSLAADLQKFADADSGSSRSDLIVIAKSVSAHIINLANELLRLAKLCTDPKLQDKLFQSAQVLRNYATQLKIMASVRAASQKTFGDSTTDQLVILAKNLSSIVGEATNVVSIMKQSKRGL